MSTNAGRYSRSMREFFVVSLLFLGLGCGDGDADIDSSVGDAGAESDSDEPDVAESDGGPDAGTSDGRYVPPGSCPEATSVPVGSDFCSGVGNTGSLECGDGRLCVSNDPQCQTGCSPEFECVTDADCSDDNFCQRVRGPATPCCVEPYLLTLCAPPCTETSCGEGGRCEADGHCAPVSCLDGNPCPSSHVCDPERVGGTDNQGCAPKNCMLDDFVCPPNTRCTSTSPLQGGCEIIVCDATTPCGHNLDCDLASGACVTRPCGSDADCDCGACINSGCAPRAYVCVDGP